MFDYTLYPKINHCRESALKLLNPTDAQLEHGLRLHADSIVCDTFGFAPNCALNFEVLNTIAAQGAGVREIATLQQDQRNLRCINDRAQRREHAAAWEASGVTCVFQQAGDIEQPANRAIDHLGRFVYLTSVLNDIYTSAWSPDCITDAKKHDKRCLYFSNNGVPLPEDWTDMEDQMRLLRRFFLLGYRMMHLTYNRRNMLGDGCAETADGGLSDFGRHAVACMNDTGIIIDVAHSGLRTSLEAARISRSPIVASHTVCSSVNAHCRAKTDEVIRAIADSGGYIGIAAVPAFLGRSGGISALLDHIDYAAKKFGAARVAIGTDNVYVSTANGGGESAGKPQPYRKSFHNFWPDGDALFDIRWKETEMLDSLAWTNWPLFTVGLIQRGYNDEDIRRIIGGNALRVALKVWADKKYWF